MSAKARHSASASSPAANGSKLPKFLQSKQTRDRSKSMIDPSSGSSSTASSSSSSSQLPSDGPAASPSSLTPKRSLMRRGSKQREDRFSTLPPAQLDPDISEDFTLADDSMEETPVIVEPISPRARTRSERPLSSASDNHLSYYQSSHSSARLTDLPTRLSGWFQHTFNTSSSDLTLPTLLGNPSHLPPASSSPKGKASALLTAAKHGKGHLDKAMRYLLDSDATPDKCTDVIWLLGVQHPGYEPPIIEPPASPSLTRRGSAESRRSPSSFRSSTSSTVTPDPSLSQSMPPSSKHPAANWPPAFYADFTSRVWITYRSHFQPIRDSTLSALESEQAQAAKAGPVVMSSASPQPKRWNWPGAGEKGWTSDAGWGCMLRTGQSLLATALVHLHLGRDWRRPPQPVYTADYATYVQILTWFFDSPSPYSPFSVHRMALAGKDLGKDVGQWFGPSTAAGAIKTLTQGYPEAGVGVAVAVDSQIFQTDVYLASHAPSESPKRGRSSTTWGGRAVIVLIGVRLGLDGVNPIYYDTIKALFTFPQSIGIAGGRPSSSYYFVGSQADTLFYLDPHHARPTIPLRPPPNLSEQPRRSERQTTPERSTYPLTHHHRAPTSPASSRTGSSTFSYHAPISPSPLSQQLSSSSSSSGNHARWQSAGVTGTPGSDFSGDLRPGSDSGLDLVQEHYIESYSAQDLKTFHCERVRKMQLSSLDPSMLIGFLCKDEEDWIDLRHRIADLSRNYKTIFSIQDEPPSWPTDSDDMGLESMSEPDVDMPEDEDEADREFFDASEGRGRSPSGSPDADASSSRGASKSGQSEVDTEEDAMGPITPGPTAMRSSFAGEAVVNGKEEDYVSRAEDFAHEDDDDDWVDPSVPTPQPQSPLEVSAPPMAKSQSQSSASSVGESAGGSRTTKKARKSSKKSTVPIVKPPEPPQQHFPFPSSDTEPEEKKRIPQMSNARARDGGRTQSGGVKGVPTTDDGDDF